MERLIEPDHLARAIWAFIGQLDLSDFNEQIKSFEGEPGRGAFAPQLLISLWVYAYSRGIGKARAISRLCDHDPAFRWLTGLQPISYHTLSSFRVAYKEKLDRLFKQILAVLDLEGLLDLRRVFHDGSKLGANASRSSFRTRKTLATQLQEAQEVINKLESEEFQEQDRRIQAAQHRAARERKQALQRALEQFDKLPKTTTRKHEMRVSATDPEARNMFTAGGGFSPSYNAQITTEAAHGFIVGGQISQCASDFQQLAPAVQTVKEYTGQTPEEFVVDSGFTSKKNIVCLSRMGIKMIGPLLPQSSTVEQLENRGVDPAFSKNAFAFDPASNTFTCPQGKILSYVRTRHGKASLEHLYMASPRDCQNCPVKEKCCGRAKEFRRKIVRTEELPEITAFKEVMTTPKAQLTYKQRAQFAEFPLAWLKEKFGVRKFQLRGSQKVAVELIWLFITFDIINFIRIKRARPDRLATA